MTTVWDYVQTAKKCKMVLLLILGYLDYSEGPNSKQKMFRVELEKAFLLFQRYVLHFHGHRHNWVFLKWIECSFFK